MRVFVTGATGFIGTGVVRQLLAAGHQVLGLARNNHSADALRSAGAEVHQGELTNPTSLTDGVRACDGTIHLAFIHDFSKYEENIRIDRVAIEAMLDALEGSNKPFVSTSGTALSTAGQRITEADGPDVGENAIPRGATEQIVVAAAGRGVRSSVMRLPPSVHGAGDHGFVPMLIDLARRTGVAGFIGDGGNRWPAVHRFDAASCFRLALEQAEPGSRFHAVAEEGVPMRHIAETIGAGLGVPVKSFSREEAAAHFGWMAHFVGFDNPSSSDWTRETLVWQPTEVDLLTDMRENGYFS